MTPKEIEKLNQKRKKFLKDAPDAKGRTRVDCVDYTGDAVLPKGVYTTSFMQGYWIWGPGAGKDGACHRGLRHFAVTLEEAKAMRSSMRPTERTLEEKKRSRVEAMEAQHATRTTDALARNEFSQKIQARYVAKATERYQAASNVAIDFVAEPDERAKRRAKHRAECTTGGVKRRSRRCPLGDLAGIDLYMWLDAERTALRIVNKNGSLRKLSATGGA